ncbi:radical SAM domain protein [delta proteobacterium NaphS2]|nr:radical SAM domain protein [delta proteobacterium NaphS2]
MTEGCNLACRHCWIQPKFQGSGHSSPAMDLGLFRLIIDQAKPLGLSVVKLTGGEPLIHPRINEMLDYIKREDLRLTVETNGVALTQELAEKMKSCKNPFVSVSIDGVRPETHEWVRGVAGCLDQAVQGIRHLVQAGFRPQVIMTIMRRNRDEMEEVVKLAESLGAGSVKFNVVQPTARGELMQQGGETLSIEELVEIGQWVETELSSRSGIRLHYGHPAAFRPLSRMFSDDGGGCTVCGIFGILGVLANGNYALCGIGETVPDLIFGHAEIDRLEDVWRNTEILQQIRSGLPSRLKEVCGECLMKERCFGSCIAQNYYRTKDLWAPFWFCQEARKKNLFPETRVWRSPKIP